VGEVEEPLGTRAGNIKESSVFPGQRCDLYSAMDNLTVPLQHHRYGRMEMSPVQLHSQQCITDMIGSDAATHLLEP
jgi:hypothetical protein